MHRIRLGRNIPAFRPQTRPVFTSRRLFGSSPQFPRQTLPPVRLLGPTVWCLAAASAVYLGCAAYEVCRDARELRRILPAWKKVTYDHIRAKDSIAWIVGQHRPDGRRRPAGTGWGDEDTNPLTVLMGAWRGQSAAERLAAAAIGVNAGIFAACNVVPSAGRHFAHTAAGGANYTLFTSMFGHVGPVHLGLNMYALYSFAEPVARSRTFGGGGGGGGHLAAFYLSTGILASLAQHLASAWPMPPAGRMIPTQGASGAVMALLGAFAMSYPDAEIGVVLVPLSFPARPTLACIALLEAYGLFVGRWMRLGHAAHLAGLAMGSAYVYFRGDERLWEPARRFTFDQMRRLDMV